MSTLKKKIIIPVINDLATDQRVLRLCQWWHKKDYDVLLYGRVLSNSPSMPNLPFESIRVKHFFNKGMFFYAEFSLRLFFFLLCRKVDVIWANDLDTLPAASFAKSLRRSKLLIYDSHEYFTEVPELQNNNFARSVWLFFEKLCVPKVDFAFTVNKSIADVYTNKYGIPFHILRNMPYKNLNKLIKTKAELGLPQDKFLVILQGSGINIDRGAEEAVEAFGLLPDRFVLVIAGSGDVISALKNRVKEMHWEHKILFFDRMPYSLLMQYTQSCNVGLSLDKDTNLNYRFSLPNKIFDYIQAHIPVLVSNLPELKRVVNEYKVGEVVMNHNPQTIADAIQKLSCDAENLNLYTQNAILASDILCREKEEIVLDIIPL